MAAARPQNPDAAGGGGGGAAALPPPLPSLHLGVRCAREGEAAAGGDAEAAAAAAALLSSLRVLRRALGALFSRDASSAAEARAWLRDAAGRAPARPAARLGALRGALARAGARSALASAALRLLMSRRPADVIALLRHRNPSLYERFFASASGAGAARISAVFGAFSPDGRHPRGASALAQYLLQRRVALWPHTVWRGAHPQAPVVVSAKPHYWCELDAPATLSALAARAGACFDFWASDEVADGLSGGDVLSLDVPFFLEELTLELGRGRGRLHELLEAVLQAEPWAQLMQRLLPTLDDDDDALLRLLRALFPAQDAPAARAAAAPGEAPGCALAAAPFAGVAWRRVEDACVAAAAARAGGHARGGAAGGLAALLTERAACGSTRAREASDAVDAALAAAAACDALDSGGGRGSSGHALAVLLSACAREAPREEGRLLLLLAAWLLRTRLARLPRSSSSSGSGAASPRNEEDASATEAVMRAAGVAHARDAAGAAGAAAGGDHGGGYALVGTGRRRRHGSSGGEDDDDDARRRKKHKKRKKRRKEERKRRGSSSDSDSDDSSGGGGAAPWAAREPGGAAADEGEEAAVRAGVAGDGALTWRCALDGFALRRGEGALRELLADAAADAWLRAIEEAEEGARGRARADEARARDVRRR
jgi:hypothetical protein